MSISSPIRATTATAYSRSFSSTTIDSFVRQNETNSVIASSSGSDGSDKIGVLDVVVFTGLEALGVSAIIGNLALILVLVRNKYVTRASFILMLSLAIADVLHGIVTTCYFYPPIILKDTHISEFALRLFNIVDWTAWAITLTHMSAICLDRLIAIILYGRYNQIVTVQRIRNYSVGCWMLFLSANTIFYFSRFCCMIRPLKAQNYYSFGYIETDAFNVYVLVYTPLEIATICVLTASNPTTLVQLYRRHKRKIALRQQGTVKSSTSSRLSPIKPARSQWQRASTMLLEMSMKMGSKPLNTDVRELAAKRANRQQQRILLQISVVALIFYAYMTAYYITYYSKYFQSTAGMIFNSFFYSTTHMINPVIYFSLNKEMRAQLRMAINDAFDYVLCHRKKESYGFATSSTKHHQSNRDLLIERTKVSTSCSESSPLMSFGNQYKSADVDNSRDDLQKTRSTDASPAEELITQQEEAMPTTRQKLANQMIATVRSSSKTSICRRNSYQHIDNMDDEDYLLESEVKNRYLKVSATLYDISRTGIDIALPQRYLSTSDLERKPLLCDSRAKDSSSGADMSRNNGYMSFRTAEVNLQPMVLQSSLDLDDEEEIAYL